MIDFNTNFVLVIMLIVALVNMLCGILVIILRSVRTIGVLKTMGMPTISIQQIFVYRSAYILLWGLLWGNLIGLGICSLQYYYDLITLNPQEYLLSSVPIWISWSKVVAINAGTFLIVVLSMFIPTLVISRISPAEAAKYN